MESNVKNPDLIPLFNQLRDLLKPYEKYFSVHHNEAGNYDLWSEKEVYFAGKKRKEVFFAGLIIQKHYVGFYYMPIYTDPKMSAFFGAELLSKLKGKSCFYITRADDTVFKQIEEALARGLVLYQQRGWVC